MKAVVVAMLVWMFVLTTALSFLFGVAIMSMNTPPATLQPLNAP